MSIEEFCSVSNLVLPLKVKWFAADRLVLNLDGRNVMKLATKIS
jgi:hypothetical protein